MVGRPGSCEPYEGCGGYNQPMSRVDAVILLGFGGPTRPQDVMPFLRLSVRGRNTPPERLEEVAHHYEVVGGRSPYNEITLRQAIALKRRLRDGYGLALPVYVGMRNWRPFMHRVVRCMNKAGRRRVIGIPLAAHRSSASGDRYRGDLARAIEMNWGQGPEILYFADDWFADPLFLEANAARVEAGSGFHRGEWPLEEPLIFTAHSIPLPAARASPYVEDLTASCRGVAEILGVKDWRLAWQSASGDGRVPWLSPDVNDVLKELAEQGIRDCVVQPIGFLHDHVEVLFDLDVEAAATARSLGMRMRRAQTVGDHPLFIDMLAGRVAALARRESA